MHLWGIILLGVAVVPCIVIAVTLKAAFDAVSKRSAKGGYVYHGPPTKVAVTNVFHGTRISYSTDKHGHRHKHETKYTQITYNLLYTHMGKQREFQLKEEGSRYSVEKKWQE